MRGSFLRGALALALVTGIGGSRIATAEEQVVVVGWGGVWQDAYRKALFEPFMARNAEDPVRMLNEQESGRGDH